MYKEYGFVRVGSIVPNLKVADVAYNKTELLKEIDKAASLGVSVILTPELSLTGYTCADLFQQRVLLEGCQRSLKELLQETATLDSVIVVGMPVRQDNKLYNAAVVLQKGNILGVVPKGYLPNHSEFAEKRWFASGFDLANQKVKLCGQNVPMATNLLFRDRENEDICLGIEIGADLWSPCPPSINHTLNGATIILNPAASSELVGQYDYRCFLVKGQSSRTISAYCYASSGVNESTTDLVFSGHALIAENGSLLKENKRFEFASNIIYADVDVQKLVNQRMANTSYVNWNKDNFYQVIEIEIKDRITKLERNYSEYPFVPSDEVSREQRCKEILTIQACGLARRLAHINTKKTVIGISGGLDSTLAYLVILEAYQRLGIAPENIIGVTMPGFGTTNRTYENACELVKCTGATLREVSIVEACLQHFQNIGIREDDRSIAYENSQARERTQILMDIANKEGALVVGTGDLSELALGWCTYNGDHMSMYAVNASVPKTLVRSLVEWKANNTKEELAKILKDILKTPISPELLPPDKYGKIAQKTESQIGPYVLHDFFLYHFFRYGASPEKLYLLARHVFGGKFTDEEIKNWELVFFSRFINQQFKRNCVPDGPKVGSVSLSPRSDFRMPSDVSSKAWLARIKKLK